MKWGFVIRQKITLSLILCIIFAVTFVCNMMSKNHVDELGASFSSVYQDRLVVESYIYRLSEIIHQKKIMMLHDNGNVANRQAIVARQNTEIASLLSHYDKTKLTPKEDVFLKQLKSSLASIALQEETGSKTPDAGHLHASARVLLTELDLAAAYLRRLSAIQLSEAGNLNQRSRSIVAGSTLISEMGTAILICSLLVVQVLLFSSRLSRHKNTINYHLN